MLHSSYKHFPGLKLFEVNLRDSLACMVMLSRELELNRSCSFAFFQLHLMFISFFIIVSYLHIAVTNFPSAICTSDRPVYTLVRSMLFKLPFFHCLTTRLALHITILAVVLVFLVTLKNLSEHFTAIMTVRFRLYVPNATGFISHSTFPEHYRIYNPRIQNLNFKVRS